MDPQPITALIVLTLTAALAFIAVRSFRSVVAPATIYIVLWGVSICLYYTGVIKYDLIRWETAVIIASTVICFYCGCMTAALPQPAAERKLAPVTGVRARATQLTILALFTFAILGSFLYYLRLHQLIGIDSLWRDPVRVRYEEGAGLKKMGWIGIARGYMIPAFVLAILGRRLLDAPYRRGLRAAAMVSFLLALPSGGRTTLITLLSWACFAVLYADEAVGLTHIIRRRARVLSLIAALVLVYFFVLGAILNKTLGDIYVISDVTRLPHALNGLVDLVHYQVGSIPAFEKLLEMPGEFHQRASLTFGVVSRVLSGINPGRFDAPEYIQPFVGIPLLTNLYTYLDAFYMDFGWWGLYIAPFVLGLASTLLYRWLRARPSIMGIYLVSLWAVCILQSTGVNRFGNLQTWFWILGPLALHAYFEFVLVAMSSARRSETALWT